MRTIPFLDLRQTYLELKIELDSAFQRVMDSGWYIHGKELTAFESGMFLIVEVGTMMSRRI